jgi:uncharacterized membrane protein YphA (DoxX/SURF4 family)
VTLRTTPSPKLIRASIALVWLYQGLWCKLLSRALNQKAVVATVPFIGADGARTVLLALGLIECSIAAWVLSGKRLRAAAFAQTALLVAMNAGGIIWASHLIPDPGNMIVENFALLVLIWIAAEGPPYAVQQV